MVRRGYSYRYSSDGDDTMALVTGNGNVSGSGQFGKHFSEVRGKVHGDFVYYEHDGHAYVIDDPAFVAQAKALYKPMEELGRQQEALGKKQEELGRQQEELGRKQELANVPTPDVSKEIPGCAFAPRCGFAADVCKDRRPLLEEYLPGHSHACVRARAGELSDGPMSLPENND